ncbi:MAG: flagellar basal-body rod protein FlgG [Spirochaetota bacterium]
MVRSLYTAASGMNAQQFNIDTISNNLSNVNTNGFKRNRADFEDLIYQTIRTAGTPATEQTLTPVGEQVGHGVQTASTQKIFEQGSPRETGVPTDIAIQGEGFFRVLDYDGSYGYTRDGNFQIDSEGQLVTAQGYRVVPEIIMPEGFIQDSLNVTQEGNVTVEVPELDEPVEVGQLELYRFANPAGLDAVGENMLKETAGSGEAIAGVPGQEGMGRTLGRFLETSNVEAVTEMVNMITAQRAYEMNSRSIQTSDSMLGIANQLKR